MLESQICFYARKKKKIKTTYGQFLLLVSEHYQKVMVFIVSTYQSSNFNVMSNLQMASSRFTESDEDAIYEQLHAGTEEPTQTESCGRDGAEG